MDHGLSLAPRMAILPILGGLASRRLSLQAKAEKGLAAIRQSVARAAADPGVRSEPETDTDDGLFVCARIYTLLEPGMRQDHLGLLFRSLVTFGLSGAGFAFKAICKGLIKIREAEAILAGVPEFDRLCLTDVYLDASPDIRMRFSPLFKRILKGLRQRETAVRYLAGRFDRGRDADPFLNHMNVRLRNPDHIIATEIASTFPAQRALGLKALSMVSGTLPARLLRDLLADEPVPEVRIALYNIVEAASVGHYKSLCYPILQFFYTRDTREAIHMFRAMVVTGKFPPFRLLKLVRNKYPALMPAIHRELSELSKFSFLIIQDIALNPKEYQGVNLEANLACVLGMVKKRPERIIPILKRGAGDEDVAAFIERTEFLLAREKKSIVTELSPMIQQVKQMAGETPPGKLAAVHEQIRDLVAGKKGSRRRFEDEVIARADLSGAHFHGNSLFFGRSVITKSDLSGAGISQAVFRKTVFYETALCKAVFERTCFDGAVFINVDFSDARFRQCSFEGACFYNCRFDGADLKEAPFTGAVVIKSTFDRTDLSDSCFAFSRISAVSFATAVLDQADFSAVRARFCQFRFNSRSTIKTENLDYNARQHQLSLGEMPRLPLSLTAEINKQIFCEFIHYGEEKFLRQNRLSLLFALDVLKPDQSDLFRLIPMLLDQNLALPGAKAVHPKTPCGIWGYAPDPGTLSLVRSYIPGVRPPDPEAGEILGLFTIGSVGSVAQTAESDIDYWVCVDENQISDKGMARLREKLDCLEEMAREKFYTQVTFFIVDITRARNNDFGESSTESSGSAQSRLLKEEFYRTMIHIAGKIPLWAVLPSAVSLNYYDTVRRRVVLTPKVSRYIDLGDINGISTAEYFGGTLWQMFKSLKSPFKSVLKMALLEKFIYEYGKQILLCNQYKDEWMNAGNNLRLAQNDSYYILMKHLVAYFETVGDHDAVQLLLTCFFLKLGITGDDEMGETVHGFRGAMIEKCMTRWRWTKDAVYRAGQFKTWAYADVAALSNTIKDYMIQTYKVVNKRFVKQQHSESKIGPEDRTVLGRKIFLELSKQPGRIEKIFIVSKNDAYYQRLHLRYLGGIGARGGWELFNKGTKEDGFKEEPLIKAPSVEKIGLWLIHNRLYNGANPIQMVPNASFVTFDDIRRLFQCMHEFFSTPLERYISFDQLLTSSRVIGVFVCSNFYVSEPRQKIHDYTVAWLNSWGELFYESVILDPPLTLQGVRQDILHRTGLKQFPLNTVFYSDKSGKTRPKGMPPDWGLLDLYA